MEVRVETLNTRTEAGKGSALWIQWTKDVDVDLTGRQKREATGKTNCH